MQIPNALGAEAAAVYSTGDVESGHALGADRGFDYSRDNFTQSGRHYDVDFDLQLNHSPAAYRRNLHPHGLFVIVGAGTVRWVESCPGC